MNMPTTTTTTTSIQSILNDIHIPEGKLDHACSPHLVLTATTTRPGPPAGFQYSPTCPLLEGEGRHLARFHESVNLRIPELATELYMKVMHVCT
jgi:hypothetical protein